MPRPTEIAADARALYGPAAVRPAAGDMGDGALWVDPGDNQALWQVQSGNWRQIALPPADDDSSIPAGVPVLRGPYVVDYTDIPHDGDTKTLWTPAVGDVLLRLFADPASVRWDQGSTLLVVQGWDTEAQTTIAHGQILGSGAFSSLDTLDNIESAGQNQARASGVDTPVTATIFKTAAPVQVVYLDDADVPVLAAHGHVELYALVARAVAP